MKIAGMFTLNIDHNFLDSLALCVGHFDLVFATHVAGGLLKFQGSLVFMNDHINVFGTHVFPILGQFSFDGALPNAFN